MSKKNKDKISTNHADGRVEVIATSQGEAYFYIPEDSKHIRTRVTTVPIILVFGHEKYNEESAKQTAVESGLAEIADREGSIVAFINPEGESWRPSDVNSYNEVLSKFTENERIATITGDGPYPGWFERIYVYAEGSGADFVAENLAKEVLYEQQPPWGTRDATPAFITLFNNTVLPASPDPAFGQDIPIIAVNPVERTEERLKALNEKNKIYAVKTSEVTKGFVKDIVLSTYEELSGTTRRLESVIIRVPNYEAEGIKETIEVRELSTGPIRYREYIPNDLDLDKESTIPLVITFHGGGNTAEHQAWVSEWPLVGKKHGFMVVSVDRHVERTASDMIELLEILFKEYPAIDKTRVYATGFSMGGVKTWNLGAKFPQYFAAIAPWGAGFIPEDAKEFIPAKSNPELIEQLEMLPYTLPLFYIAGGTSPLPELPSQPEKNIMDDALAFFLKMNKVVDRYEYDESEDKTWGIAPTKTYSLHNEVLDFNTVVSLYPSEDNQIYTALAVDVEKSHVVHGMNSWITWDFIRRFSRDSDGRIIITKSDDGSE